MPFESEQLTVPALGSIEKATMRRLPVSTADVSVAASEVPAVFEFAVPTLPTKATAALAALLRARIPAANASAVAHRRERGGRGLRPKDCDPSANAPRS